MLGELTANEIEEVLHGTAFGRLGCCLDGLPYIFPLGYGYDGRRILVQTVAGQKIDIMRANPEVCFEVEDVLGPTNWRTVIVRGIFTELAGADAATAVGLIVDKLLPIVQEGPGARYGRAVTPTIRDAEFRPGIVFSIEIREKTGRFELQQA
ncbi:MAG: pyridoxamine 5'-phosphate oxidase family protein [Fimbriimonas sp.]